MNRLPGEVVFPSIGFIFEERSIQQELFHPTLSLSLSLSGERFPVVRSEIVYSTEGAQTAKKIDLNSETSKDLSTPLQAMADASARQSLPEIVFNSMDFSLTE